MLMALESVDEVRVFDAPTPIDLIEEIRPDVLVKGGDYSPEEVVEREYAGKTLCISTGVQVHTSDLIREAGSNYSRSRKKRPATWVPLNKWRKGSRDGRVSAPLGAWYLTSCCLSALTNRTTYPCGSRLRWAA
jgi:hypothetical protein